MGATVCMLQCHLQHNILSVGVKKGTKRWGKMSRNVLQLTAITVLVSEVAPWSLPFVVCSGTPHSSPPPPPPMFAILWCKAQGPDSTFPSHWLIARGYVCFGASVRQHRGFEAKALACEQPLTNTWNTRSAQWSKKVSVWRCVHWLTTAVARQAIINVCWDMVNSGQWIISHEGDCTGFLYRLL